MKQKLLVSVKTIVAILFIYLIAGSPALAQLNGTYTINYALAASATNYKDFGSAAEDLSGTARDDGGPSNGPGASGDVTFNVSKGLVFQEYPVFINYTNPNHYNITFQTNGTPGVNNPVLVGHVGQGDSDAVIKLNGAGYYTFNGIDFYDSPNNSGQQNMEMEYGIYLRGLTATGCQHNIFENDTITLNKEKDLGVTNAPAGVYTVSMATTVAATNSYNTFTNVTVTDANIGYYFGGYNPISGIGVMDEGNVINTNNGGRSVITNVGPDIVTNGTITEGIYYVAQNDFSVTNTNINHLTYYNTNSSDTGAIYGIYGDYDYGTPTGIYTFNADTIESLSVEENSAVTATIEGNYLGAPTPTINLTNCVMDSFNNSAAGRAIYGIDLEAEYTGITVTTLTISGNTLSNFNSSAGGGDILGFNTGPIGSLYYNTINMFNNDFSDFTCNAAGAYTVYGVQLSSDALSFHNNKFSSFAGGTGDGLSGNGITGLYLVAPTGNLIQFHDDTLTGFTAPSSIAGIEEDFFFPSSISIYNNVFSNFSSTASESSVITGLTASVASDTVYDNYIYSFSNSATAGKIIGLEIDADPVAGTPEVVYNNMVYDLQANNSTISSNGGSVVGIELPNVDNAGAAVELYFNTVFINGAAAVAGEYSSTLLVKATSGTVSNGYDIRNNILVNDYSVPDINDHAVAIWYDTSYANFQGISNTTNNNLLYAGIPSAKNLIFYCKRTRVSDSVQTLAAYKTLLGGGKESKSVTENPPFMSVTSPINVNINNTIYTQAESGGQVITSPAINTDINGNIRAVSAGYTGCGTAPDIGADEFCGIPDTAFAISGPTIVKPEQSGVLFSVSPIPDATTYNWSLPAGASITVGANTDSITVSFGADTGNYTISVYATNCCGNGVSHTSGLKISNVTGINLLAANNSQLSVYPNPSSGQFTLNLNGSGYISLKIYNEVGGEIYSQQLNESGQNKNLDINLSNVSNGIYFLQVQTVKEIIGRGIAIQK